MNIKWMMRRLRAMSAGELLWRVKMKSLTKQEKKRFYDANLPVTNFSLPAELAGLTADSARLCINWENAGTRYTDMQMFGLYDERAWRTKWNAGFQTENTWPEAPYSPTMRITGRTDIGDIRTNWELSRHFQLAQLAKSYYVSGSEDDLNEFAALFADWNAHNLFLHGAQWTSAMESAIRVNSWIYAWCFLCRAFEKWGKRDEGGLLDALSHGILTMTAYIVRHRAHGSSANNHLIVELYAIGMAAVLYDYVPWLKLAADGLTCELVRQNTADGVNREMATHYQAFGMEAYGLLMVQPAMANAAQKWKPQLQAMSRFLCDCCGKHGETMIFGDDDSGKILDLGGRNANDIHGVLQLMGFVLDETYIDEPFGETLGWLFDTKKQAQYVEKTRYSSPLVSVRREGGYTILRSRDESVLLAMDHGELGFGTLAAHGHADALSIQLFANGKKFLTDPGTWNYHMSVHLRDMLRSAEWHSTAYVAGRNQSEILGPFLWGKRAQTRLLDVLEADDGVTLRAQTQYDGITHTRTLHFDRAQTLVIEDAFDGLAPTDTVRVNFSLPPNVQVAVDGADCTVTDAGGSKTVFTALGDGTWTCADYTYSPAYNHCTDAVRIVTASLKNEIHLKSY